MGNWFREQWEHIRGDAKWKAIEWLAGTGMISFILSATVGWITSRPILEIIALSFVIASLSIFLVEKVFGWWKRGGEGQSNLPILTKYRNQKDLNQKDLQEVSYLTINNMGISSSSSTLSESEDYSEIAVGPTIVEFHMLNTLQYGDPRARETDAISVEITYYDSHWQRLLGPRKGGWISIHRTEEGLEKYLDVGPVALRPQIPQALAVIITPRKAGDLFALTADSLPFLSWANPALRLPKRCYLQIILIGKTVQQTFYCYVQSDENGTYDYGSVPPPEVIH